MGKIVKFVCVALTAVLALEVCAFSNVRAEDTVPPDAPPTTVASTTTVAPTTTVASTTTVVRTKIVASTTTTTTPRRILKPEDIIKISKIQTNKPIVFITIDDGVTVSPELAKVLDKYHTPVTTFAMPEMLWRARSWYRARQNMIFENHTNTHAHMTSISPSSQVIELCWSNKIIKELFHESPIMYRPPRGEWSQENRIAMAKCGLKYAVLWSVAIESSVPENLVFHKGDIILFHYLRGLSTVLEQVLKKLKEQKLQPALLRDYLK